MMKTWSADDVIQFLTEESDIYQLTPENIAVFGRQELAGMDLLTLTQQELEERGVPFGPARRIMRWVEALKTAKSLPGEYGKRRATRNH
ncbi:hypothetical protein BC938DRAFT_480263 [Jimgerdemannia flammicorona]|uniref:Uncharacterized protein n=1 Tax=Jimgerdemannia flammicorona TaxID=994334 RepID=A0A433QXD1_9FUNG|nr:hypothetical protein BC938DRAFT_480263 [Jimgerdemannia flammicorona]